MQILQLDLKRLLDLDLLILADFLYISQVSEEPGDPIERDWIPIEMHSSDLDIIIH